MREEWDDPLRAAWRAVRAHRDRHLARILGTEPADEQPDDTQTT